MKVEGGKGIVEGGKGIGTVHSQVGKFLGLFGKWRIQVDGRGLKEILGNFDL
jgi:hypothetical protein